MDDAHTLKREANPREKAGIFSKITLMYSIPIFLKGRKKDFTEDDIYETLNRDKSSVLGNKVEKLWSEELRRCSENKKAPNLKSVLMKMVRFELIKVTFGYALAELVFKTGQILCMGYIVSHYLDKTEAKKEIPYFYVTGLLLSSLLNVLTFQPLALEGFHIGMEVRIAACSLIYRKALRLNQSAFGQTTVGQMINLLSNDVSVFDRAMALFQMTYIAPFQLVLYTILMYFEVGYSSFIGIGVLVLFMPLQNFLANLTAKFRLKTATRTDSRIRLMNEIVRGIEIIKMYAWETSFAKLVGQYRRLEIKSLTTVSYIKASYMIYFIYISLPLFLTTLSYILFGNTIDARKVFFSTALFNIAAFNMGTVFPQSVAILRETVVSSQRIEKFLLLDEADTYSKNIGGAPVEMHNVTAKWSKAVENTLSNITFTIKPGTLVAIVGPVGSGKSSLLQCLLRELTLTTGSVSLNGTVSYSSQDPWIFNSSVRQNIVFGSAMDLVRYKQVINVCALVRDLKIFFSGDKMIVGEQGSSLSGGQKARINLARAVYRDADIYLLDDPLSAVDVNVGRQIFDDCISGYLKKKTVILVTHQLQYLQQVDRIIVLENGVIKADGTFKQLQDSDLDFVNLLKRDVDNDDGEQKESRDSKYESNIKLNETSPKIVEEQRSTGTVSMSAYVDYALACGSHILLIVVVTLFILGQILLTGSFFCMTYWVNFEQSLNQSTQSNVTNEFENTIVRNNYIYVYSAMSIGLVVITLIRNIASFNVCMRSSIQLHDSMFKSVVHASMRFFNTNSAGRILNRFTKDMGIVDELLPITIIITVQTIFSIVAILIVTCIINPWMIIPSILVMIGLNYIKAFYLSSSLSIKRLEGITRSPVFGHLHATLQGLTTIRGFGVQEMLMKEFDAKQDLNSSISFTFIVINRTLSYWLDFISFIYLTIVTLVLTCLSDETYGGNIGLAITQALQLLSQFQWGVRQSTDMENYMTSAERVLEYNYIDHERSLTSEKKPDASWPKLGKIIFEKVYLSYSADELVLKNLNFTIQPEEKVGIVGRTGAGKSSVISAIFQLYDIEGNIFIDGISSKEIGLHDLRKKISIIPQNPVIFAGSIRKNLDPFDESPDEALWKALEEVKMKEAVEALDYGLQMEISEGGSNLSVGQRQLICLARAIIRNNKILILDEATANVDPQTDAVIQETIRRKFSNCTVITVAHRLQTIIDSDKILVLDAGEVVEFDHPYTLLQNPDGSFYNMVQQTDKNMTADLIRIAKQKYNHIEA